MHMIIVLCCSLELCTTSDPKGSVNINLQTYQRCLSEFPTHGALVFSTLSQETVTACPSPSLLTNFLGHQHWLFSYNWPVLHESDLPLAGDLFSVLRRRVLHGARGRSHDDALSQARVGRPQLVGGDVSSGSYRRRQGRKRRDGHSVNVSFLCSSFVMTYHQWKETMTDLCNFFLLTSLGQLVDIFPACISSEDVRQQ